MAKQHPDIKIIYISEKEYKQIEYKFKKKVANWE